MTAVNLDFLTYTYNVNRIFKRHLIDFGMNSLNLCTKQQFQFKWFELTAEVKTDINIMLYITIFNCQGKKIQKWKDMSQKYHRRRASFSSPPEIRVCSFRETEEKWNWSANHPRVWGRESTFMVSISNNSIFKFMLIVNFICKSIWNWYSCSFDILQ